MTKVSEITDPFFSHDFYPQKSKKIVALIDDMGYEGYGLYWRIVEFLHCNTLQVGEERLVAGKVNEEKVKSVLNDFNLFKINDEQEYYSDRIIKNIDVQANKAKRNSKNAQRRWILAALKKAYIEVFGIEPVLNEDEIETYIKYATSITGFKEKLHDILYTTKCIKFKNNPDFICNINWLLKENYMTNLLNGGYGELKNWRAHVEYIEQQNQTLKSVPETKENQPEFDSKIDALEYIIKNLKDIKFISPDKKELMEKFDITKKELQNYLTNKT